MSATRRNWEVLDASAGWFVSSVAQEEAAAADRFGICFAGLDALPSPQGSDADMHWALSQVLAAAPDAISPLAACECARREPPVTTEGTA